MSKSPSKSMSPPRQNAATSAAIEQRNKFTNDRTTSSSNSISNAMVIPKHIIDAADKRRQRKIYKKILQRAGLYSGPASLSCLEREAKGNDLKLRKTDRQLKSPNERRLTSPASSSKTNQLWLGAASRKLLSELELSRQFDNLARPIKVDPMSKSKESSAVLKDPMIFEIQKRSTQIVEEEVLRMGKASGDRKSNIKERRTISAKGTGKNSYDYPDGSLSNEEFESDIRDGFGKTMYSNGTMYIGNWLNDQPHGHGKAIYSGGTSYYEGNWNNGHREGQGKMVFSDGSFYEGGFLNRFHGEGVFTSPKLGLTYKGKFYHGNVCDRATIRFGDGEEFNRTWGNNTRLTLNEAVDKVMKEKTRRLTQRKKTVSSNEPSH